MQNDAVGGSTIYPRFRFGIGMAAGVTYKVEGTLTGDTASVASVRLAVSGGANYVSYDSGTGVLSGTLASAGDTIEFIFNGTLGPTSVTIESLSIREVIAAPTNVANGFVNGDFSRTSGLTGDGTSYIDSGRANDDDPQNDNHNAVFISAINSFTQILGSRNSTTGRNFMDLGGGGYKLRVSARSDTVLTTAAAPDSGTVIAHARSDSAEMSYRLNGVTYTDTLASESPDVDTLLVYARRNVSTGVAENFSTNTLAFYSIGTSLSLEALDTAVTNLINRLKFALLVGENPSGLDPDTIDYIVRGYEAGGTLE
jgi:hypothetical protein